MKHTEDSASYVEEPSVPFDIPDDGGDTDTVEFDKFVIAESGYDVNSGKGLEIFENAVSDNTDGKIFTVRDSENSDDGIKQSFKIDDAVYKIIENEAFDEYWRKRILENLDTEKDKKLLEQCDSESFIGDCVYNALDRLGRLEVFYYVDFFKNIVEISDNEYTVSLVDIDDELFGKMLNVMRLY